ncbi:MAG: DUF2608 domain-containing protein, partial [Candidatus Babeliales bacterium]
KLFALVLSCLVIAVSFYKFQGSSVDVSVQIVESNSIQDVKKFIESDTLFIFDYDNVLVEGKLDYGFDAWFCAMMGKLEGRGLSTKEAKAKLLPVYEEIQRSAVVQAVEPDAKNLIENLKNDGHKVMILTVRSLCLIESVFKQLKSVEIDVERDSIPENGINSTLSKLGSKYFNGILFCDGYYKGPALKAFLLGHPELKIKKIVFVDDKLKNLESVKVSAQELGIKFVGLRYACTDARTKAYKLDEKSLMLAASLAGQDLPSRDVTTKKQVNLLHSPSVS